MDLNALQAQLEHLYDVRAHVRVADFLVCDPGLVRQLSADRAQERSRETLLIRQEEDCLDLALYLDRALLDQLARDNPTELLHDGNLAEFWFALEGVSHFLYLVWNAGFERAVTQLELEIQAEIDKFILTAALVYRQRGNANIRLLRRTLFEKTRLRKGLNGTQQQRYRAANRLAARYCSVLEEKYLRIPHNDVVINELRRFYRMPQGHKIRHIQGGVVA